jgi:hypothetical protein
MNLASNIHNILPACLSNVLDNHPKNTGRLTDNDFFWGPSNKSFQITSISTTASRSLIQTGIASSPGTKLNILPLAVVGRSIIFLSELILIVTG